MNYLISFKLGSEYLQHVVNGLFLEVGFLYEHVARSVEHSLGVAADVIEHNLLPDGGELQFSYTLDSGAETLISRNSVLITVEPLKKQETEVE